MIAKRLENLQALLDETKDLALFRERLAELLDDTSSDKMATILGNGRVNARLMGLMRAEGNQV